jgi:RHS repeat-associated protein
MLLGVLASVGAQAEGTVGRTAGAASVTATGAARYVIPLSLPPGTNGLAPGLAVAYDSRSSHGLLGAGFRLEGFSTIHRCASTLAQDGRLAAVALETGDRLCLDGQRLRLAAGVHGQAGAQYRTEIETFARATAFGSAGSGPAWFRVESADGLLYEFGATADSRIESAGSATPRAWAVNRIADRAGNYVDFSYGEDAGGGAFRPSRVDYAGNTLTGTPPYYSVRFSYEARPADDQPGRYVAGGKVSESQRLDRIDVVHLATLGNVRSYDFTYATPGATGRSRLAQVQECARSTCLPATRFEWSSGQPGWSAGSAVSLAAERLASAVPGDLDGDGFDDLAYYDPGSRSWWVLRGSATGFATPASNTLAGADGDASRAVSADLDGDGRREVLVPQGGYWQWLRRTSTGSYAYGSTGIPATTASSVAVAADVDGDGRDDFVLRTATGDALRWRRSLATASAAAFATEQTLWTAPAGFVLSPSPFVQAAQRYRSAHRAADINGDGRDDLIVLTTPSNCGGSCAAQGRWNLLASNGTTLTTAASIDGTLDALLGDFNADGLTDFAYAVPQAGWHLLLGAGTRGSAPAVMAGPFPTSAAVPIGAGTTLATDWNDDGRTDLVQVNAAGDASVCKSDGVTLSQCQSAGAQLVAAVAAPLVLDANGDDLQDVVHATSTGPRLLAHHAMPSDLLLGVTDGLGATSTFAYAPLTSTTAHAVGSGAVFPVREHVRPGRVVTAATLATEAGLRREAYFYEGARVHVQGRGFLGFARRTTRELSGGLTRVEEYSQDPAAYDRIGAISTMRLQQPAGGLVANTVYRWSRHVYGGGYEARAYPYVWSSTTDRYELDGVRVMQVSESDNVDTFGTRVRRQVTRLELAKGATPGAQHVEVTTLGGVVNDTQNWCLGRPATTQVSRQHNLPTGAQVVRNYAHSWDLAKCRTTQNVVEPASAKLRVTTDYTYDSYGNVASMSVTPIEKPVRISSQSWTADGRFPATSTNPEGHVIRTTWDPILARPESVVDANGLATRSLYDDFGRETRSTRPDGTSTSIARLPCGIDCPSSDARLVVGVTQRGVGDLPLSYAETGYDLHGRAVYSREDQPGGAQVLRMKRYDPRGRLLQESIPAACCAAPTYWVTYGYDLLGRRVRQERPPSPSQPTPAVTAWRHDGLIVTETDPLGRNTTRKYNSLGAVAQVIDPAYADTDYEYDAFGNLVKVRDFRGVETRIAYDSLGRRTSMFDPTAGIWLYGYTPLGELAWQVNGRGQVTTFEYDRLSRPVMRTEIEGITTWAWGNATEAHNVGALESVMSPGFQQRITYDGLGRLQVVNSLLQGESLVMDYTYDPVSGLRDTITYPASGNVAPLRVREHHDRGRLVELTDADSGQRYWRLDGIDAFGHVTEESLGNGVQVASHYDTVHGWLLERMGGPGGGASHQNLAYDWDVAGNLVRRRERNGGVDESFTYDTLDRLDHVQRNGALTLDLAYDAVGNLTYKSDVGNYQYDTSRRNAVVSAGANRYGYDANGAIVDANGTLIHWLSYDLPARIQHPGGNYSTFGYGPDRARFMQLARAAGTVTETLYAADGLYERVTTQGEAKHRYYIVANGRRVAVQTRTAGESPETVYLLEEQLGGVDGFTSDDGELLSRNSYQPFGAHRGGDWLGSTPTTEEWEQMQATTARGYTGHEHLNNLGVIHMNGRVYDPVLARFLSPDPIVQAPHDTQGFNRYAYVRNNPLRYTDPSGFCANLHPAADVQAYYCMELILVQAARQLVDVAWLQQLGEYASLMGLMGEAGDVSAETWDPNAPPEEIIVSAARPSGIDLFPVDVASYAGYSLYQSALFDSFYQMSTELGESAVNYYVQQQAETGNPLYSVPGSIAALWTPQTAGTTSLVLGFGSGLGAWSARPFWQYFPAGNQAYRSTWLTRGSGWTPPLGIGSEAASMLSLPTYNPGSAVRVVQPAWYEYIRGPRVVDPQPGFGEHAVGGGLEYRVLPFDK